MSEPSAERSHEAKPAPTDTSRRTFLTATAAVAASTAIAGAGALTAPAIERILARRFRELSPAAVESLCRDLEEEYQRKYARDDIGVDSTAALPQTRFGYALDLSRCIGCRRCVYACAAENNQSRDPQVHWIRVLQMEKEKGIDLSESNAYYDPKTVPEDEFFYVPVACQQCDRPPCTRACPVGATWQEPDGIVVIDYDWCIGCRCCVAACPYGARHFNWAEPTLPSDEVNPNMHVLGNRPRPSGVVEKCTFCIQRVRAGRYPACVEVCPVGARKFGNLLDRDGELRHLMREKRVFVLKEELNTQPKFFYFYAT